MATIVNSTESNGFLVVHSHEAGQRVVRVAEFLSTLEEAYNALILLDRFLDEMPQPTATVRPFESDTARIRGARSRIEWHPSARSYAGLISTRDSLRRAAQIIQPNARLRLYAVEVHSPGFWAFAGKLIPFDCIRQWIQDAHERRKDRAYREADEEERSRVIRPTPADVCASETRGCCPASVSRRSLTPCSCLTSCKIAFESMRFAAFLRSLETRGLQMGPHVLEKLKKGSRSISKSGTLMNAIKMR